MRLRRWCSPQGHRRPRFSFFYSVFKQPGAEAPHSPGHSVPGTHKPTRRRFATDGPAGCQFTHLDEELSETKTRASANGLGGAASIDGFICPPLGACQRQSQQIVATPSGCCVWPGPGRFSRPAPYLSHNVTTSSAFDTQCFAPGNPFNRRCFAVAPTERSP